MMGVEGFGWGFMGLGMVFFWVFLIAGTVWLVLTLSGQATQRREDDRGSAVRILEERVARGEIDVDEYKARTAAIGGAR